MTERKVTISEAVAEKVRLLVERRTQAEQAFASADAMAQTFLEGVCGALNEPFEQLTGIDPDTRELVFTDPEPSDDR